MKLATLPALLLLTFALAACTSDDDDQDSSNTNTPAPEVNPDPDPDPDTNGEGEEEEEEEEEEENQTGTSDNITQWGLIELDTEDEVDIVGVFGRFVADYTEDEFEEDLLPELDVCEVETVMIGEEDGDDDLSFDFSVDFETISAGDAIILTSPAGTFATLTPGTIGKLAVYLDDGPTLAGPAPAGLTVDIPGAAFPAFISASIPDVAELEFTSPAEDVPVTPTTAFVWNAGTSENSIVDISATFVNTAAGTETTVECAVNDDGAFSFTAATQAEMGAGFNGTSVDFSRTRFELIESGTSVLVLSNSSDS